MRVRVCGHAPVREMWCKVLVLSDIGRNELEIRRQYYCTAFSLGVDAATELQRTVGMD